MNEFILHSKLTQRYSQIQLQVEFLSHPAVRFREETHLFSYNLLVLIASKIFTFILIPPVCQVTTIQSYL